MVLERVKALVAEQFDVEEDALGAETAFEELGAEPEDVVDFLLALDDEFDIDLSDMQPDRIVTIGDAVAVVKEVLGQ